MSEGILLRFANEEMIYLLRSLRLVDFPGMAPESLKDFTDSQKSLLMMEADHTLRARGLVHWRGETEREIDPLVSKLLLECAQPRYTLFIDLLEAGTPATQLLYLFGPEVIVEQCEPEPQVQQYLVIRTLEDFARRLGSLVVLEQGAQTSGLPGGEIEEDLWEQALPLAREDQAGAGSLLARSLPAQTAEALAEALHGYRRVQYLARWRQTPSVGRRVPEMALTLVSKGDRLFLLWREEADSSYLKVISTGVERAWGYISRLIPC
jgi:hypothetical protein